MPHYLRETTILAYTSLTPGDLGDGIDDGDLNEPREDETGEPIYVTTEVIGYLDTLGLPSDELCAAIGADAGGANEDDDGDDE